MNIKFNLIQKIYKQRENFVYRIKYMYINSRYFVDNDHLILGVGPGKFCWGR